LDLIGTIETMVDEGLLGVGNGNALISKINNAIKSLDKGNTNAVSGQLGAFINEVEAFVDNGKFTEEQGQTLITVAENGIILSDGSFIDPRDGYEYPVVLIGEQLWVAENLKTTKYNDGTAIPLVTDLTAWSNLTTGAYCNYNNDVNTATTYDRLYNWYTVVDSRNLCPTGWHVPTHSEWTELTVYLAANGHSGTEGTALKATNGWQSGGNGTDDYGFTALPGGARNEDGSFEYIGSHGVWWTSSEYSAPHAYSWYLRYHHSGVTWNSWYKEQGLSVRCLRD